MIHKKGDIWIQALQTYEVGFTAREGDRREKQLKEERFWGRGGARMRGTLSVVRTGTWGNTPTTSRGGDSGRALECVVVNDEGLEKAESGGGPVGGESGDLGVRRGGRGRAVVYSKGGFSSSTEQMGGSGNKIANQKHKTAAHQESGSGLWGGVRNSGDAHCFYLWDTNGGVKVGGLEGGGVMVWGVCGVSYGGWQGGGERKNTPQVLANKTSPLGTSPP